MSQTAWIAYTAGLAIVAAYAIYQQFRNAKLFDLLEHTLDKHMQAYSSKQTGRARRNSPSMRFRRLYYAYAQLDHETLSFVRIVLKQLSGQSSYIYSLFGLILRFLLLLFAFALGAAVFSTGSRPEAGNAIPLVVQTAENTDLPQTFAMFLTGDYAPVTAFVFTLFALAALHLLYSTYRNNKIACHLLLIEQVLEDRKTAGTESEEEQTRGEEHDPAESAAITDRTGDPQEEQTQEQEDNN
jgi:hypothetical protein